MEKKRTVELLIQEVEKIPYLKNLPFDNDEFKLWLKNLENIMCFNTGLEQEDFQKFREASNFLRYIRFEDELKQKDYIDEIVRYEIALKSIIQKYEILGIVPKYEGKIFSDDKVNSPIQLFDIMQFHQRIVKVSRKRFESGNYEDAIYRAFVEVNNFVKEKSCYNDVSH